MNWFEFQPDTASVSCFHPGSIRQPRRSKNSILQRLACNETGMLGNHLVRQSVPEISEIVTTSHVYLTHDYLAPFSRYIRIQSKTTPASPDNSRVIIFLTGQSQATWAKPSQASEENKKRGNHRAASRRAWRRTTQMQPRRESSNSGMQVCVVTHDHRQADGSKHRIDGTDRMNASHKPSRPADALLHTCSWHEPTRAAMEIQ